MSFDYSTTASRTYCWCNNIHPAEHSGVGGSVEQRRALDEAHARLVTIYKMLTPTQKTAWEILWPHDKYRLAELSAEERAAQLDELAKSLDFGEPLEAGHGIEAVEPEAA